MEYVCISGNMRIVHGSLFSGFGGFDLAAEWMGWENVFHCEWMPFPRHILNFYWPEAKSYEDIRKTDFTIWRGRIDVLSGGFPCQPYSSAGKRKGKEDERHLWPEMLRAIREIQPVYVVGENVRGLTNWNGGLVFDEVQSDLETEGYEVLPFLLPACAVDAPHRRDRIWFVAYKDSNRNGRTDKQWENKSGIGQFGDIGSGNNEWLCPDHGQAGIMANAGSIRRDNWCNNWKRRYIQTNLRTSKKDKQERNGWVNRVRSTGAIFANANMHGCNGCNGQHEVNTSEGGQYAQRDIKQVVNNELITDTESEPSERVRFEQREISEQKQGEFRGGSSQNGSDEFITDTNGFGLRGESNGIRESGLASENKSGNYWQNFPTQSPICSGDDGLSYGLDSVALSKVKGEEMMNDKRAYNYWRQESIKGFGNAVVPQLVLPIFKAIEEMMFNELTNKGE